MRKDLYEARVGAKRNDHRLLGSVCESIRNLPILERRRARTYIPAFSSYRDVYMYDT